MLTARHIIKINAQNATKATTSLIINANFPMPTAAPTA
jgi:hypothetical protein